MSLKKHIAEGFLIIFSVLFALFINKLFDDYQMNRKKEIAIESIKKELKRNEAILKIWKEKHTAIRGRIANIVNGKNDSLKAEFSNYNFFNLGLLTNNESLIDAILTNTAWESAKSTGIISEFDFATAERLTQVYNMQEILSERTIIKILDYYFDSNTHKLEDLDQIMIQFQLRFWELTGQEELLINLYKETLEDLEK